MLTDFGRNKLVDAMFRGQAIGAPATWYVGLSKTTPNAAGAVTQPSSWTTYARQAISASLAAWAGTQGDGTTTASSGTGGTTSNNAQVTFGTPNVGAEVITHFFVADAASGGNVWAWFPLTDEAGSPVSVTTSSLSEFKFLASRLRPRFQ